jgi:hypothetical protein
MQSALEQARDADVVVKASGVGVFDAELEAGVVSLKRPDNIIVYWDVDAPATLDRLLHDAAAPLRAGRAESPPPRGQLEDLPLPSLPKIVSSFAKRTGPPTRDQVRCKQTIYSSCS